MEHPRQLSLFDDDTALAGLMPSIKATMNRVCREWCERHAKKREALLELLNERAEQAGVSLAAGNGKLSMAVFEKWLSPRDTSNQPGVVAVNAFCRVTGDFGPLDVMLGIHGCEIMKPRDRKLRDYGEAQHQEKKARQKKKQLEADLDD